MSLWALAVLAASCAPADEPPAPPAPPVGREQSSRETAATPQPTSAAEQNDAQGIPDELGPGIHFRDVAREAGIVSDGIGFGIEASDFDSDGFVDLFIDNHYKSAPQLWRNRGDGTFEDVTGQVLKTVPNHPHGGQWADVDNNGRPDLLLLRGGAGGFGANPNVFYLNHESGLTETAVGLEYPLSRGRTPLAMDYDADGKLDFFLTAMQRPDRRAASAVFLQTDAGGFVDASAQLKFHLPGHCQFGILADLTGDGRLDAFFHGSPPAAFALGSTPIEDISSLIPLPKSSQARDAAIADFNGDGRNEIYLARARNRSHYHLENETTLEASYYVERGEVGLSFAQEDAEGEFRLTVGSNLNVQPEQIFIGSEGYHPKGLRRKLSAEKPRNIGLPSYEAGTDDGVFIGFDVATKRWHVRASCPQTRRVLIAVETASPLRDIETVGFRLNLKTLPDWYLVSGEEGYTDAASQAGLGQATDSESVVCADFDNDMDLDLYVVTTTSTENSPNQLFENQGDGAFAVLAGAGGAAGSTHGRGNGVVTLDYDNDGRVDLLVSNGEGPKLGSGELRFFSDDGPLQLFRNTTENGNHWLSLRLVGTRSNRDAIGATVTVSAGSKKQIREQSGGMHRYSQNHGMHFGLGPHARAEQVEIRWPEGKIQVLSDVAADQLLVVTEPR